MAKKDDKAKETEELKQKIEELENQSRSDRDQTKRVLADYQNLEKRVLEERKLWIQAANKELLLRILPILDTLRIASEHSEDENLRISVKQFEDVLSGEGIVKIETEGQEFNPQTMECVATVKVDPSAGSGQEEGKIVEEIRPGYMLHDKVLRVAQVKVGKASN